MPYGVVLYDVTVCRAVQIDEKRHITVQNDVQASVEIVENRS